MKRIVTLSAVAIVAPDIRPTVFGCMAGQLCMAKTDWPGKRSNIPPSPTQPSPTGLTISATVPSKLCVSAT